MKILISTIIVIMAISLSFTQTTDNFDDGDFSSNPEWVGDIDNFIVNDKLMLQLNAPEAGNSLLSINHNFSDSVKWEIDFEMDFSPSSGNALSIILWQSTTEDRSYEIQIGETGSEDAIELVQMLDGAPTVLGRATDGAVSSSPDVHLVITKSSDDTWEVKADYNDGLGISSEIMMNWNTPDLSGNHLMTLSCTYTASRTDLFFFDNVFIGDLLPDITAPSLTSFSVESASNISLNFDEALEPSIAENLNNYSLNNNAEIAAVELSNTGTSISLMSSNPLSSEQEYTLTIDNIEDLEGNTIDNPIVITIQVAEPPSLGDLIINEILFDPYPTGEDYVELYNNSNKLLDLSGLMIRNADKSEEEMVLDGLRIAPKSYLALTEDKDALLELYTVIESEAIIEQDLPSFNNDDGNVSLVMAGPDEEILLDAFDYQDDYHFILIDDTEGVSLERIDQNSATNTPENWNSAASSAGFGTPGYQNSSFQSISDSEGFFNIEETTFSPNDDGDRDVLLISYSLDSPSYIANAQIYDAHGRKIKTLLNNELLSTSGTVKWDGTNDEDTLAKIGIYVIWFQVFNTNGDVSEFKKTVVLADFLN